MPNAGDVRDAGGRVVVGTDAGTLHVWDEASGQEIARQCAHPSGVDRPHCGRGGAQVVALLDAFEEDLTAAAFTAFALILGGFALRSWLH